MKKNNFLTLVIMLILVSLIFSSCTNGLAPQKNELTTKNPTIASSVTTEPTNLDKNGFSDNLNSAKDVGGGDLGLLKYRMNYYDVPAPFAEIVEPDLFDDWYTEVLAENPNETNVMVMKRFIQHFDVSREDFDKANLKWAKIIVEGMDGEPVLNPKDFADQELSEIYNADILYTLDDAMINEYYLSHDYPYVYSYDYKKAVENGKYITQTTDWVDIEQMEAEIIAKYGETEIIPETATLPEETTA